MSDGIAHVGLAVWLEFAGCRWMLQLFGSYRQQQQQQHSDRKLVLSAPHSTRWSSVDFLWLNAESFGRVANVFHLLRQDLKVD